MSIASPTRRKNSPQQGSEGSWVAKLKRNLTRLGENQYRHVSSASLRGVPVLLLLIAIGMTAFGIIMILSASSVEEISAGNSPFNQVMRQGIFAVLGFVGLTVAALIPVHWYRRRSVLYLLMVGAVLVQLLTVLIGKEVNGNRNWIVLGPLQLQPSELSKLIFAMWGSYVLIHQGNITRYTRKGLFPLLLGLGPLVIFILMGHDVGTVLVYAMMLLGLLWFAGLSNKAMLYGAGAAAVLGVIAVISSPNRIARVLGIFGNCQGATCDQSNAGLAALTTGGFWGVGLGRSRQKYNYLPEAHNDYIFAVVGEELGLIGSLLIILLYLGLVYCCVRIMVRTADRFIALTTGAIMVWLIGQAMINIAMVTGFLPVIGIPLPLISYGGSSLITSLTAIGVLIAFARQTPLLSITDFRNPSYYPGSNDMRDIKRRRPLGELVAKENAALRKAGDSAGWDIKVLFDSVSAGMGQGKKSSAGRGTSRARLSAQRRPHEPQGRSQRSSAPGLTSQVKATRGSGSRRPADRNAARAAAPQQVIRGERRSSSPAPKQRESSTTARTSSRPPQRSASSQRKDATSSQTAVPRAHKEQKLPEGLAPVKKLRETQKKQTGR